MFSNLNTSQLKYFIPFALIVTVFIFNARLIRLYTKKVSYAFLVIFQWAALINLLFFGDYFELRGLYMVLALIFIEGLLIGATLYKFGFNAIINDKTETGSALKSLALWVIGIGILIIPLVFIFPKGTVITGFTVNDDSLNHTILAKGFAENRANLFLDPIEGYPRGFHSFIYYTNKIFNEDNVYMMLPATIFGYSFILFAALDIAGRLKKGPAIAKYIISIIVAIAFLNFVTTYYMAITQVAVIPLLMLGLFYAIELKFDGNEKFEYFAWIVICIAIMNVYAVYALSIVILALGVKVVYILFKHRKIKLSQFDMKNLINTKTLLFLLLLLIMLVPTVILTKNNVSMLLSQYTSGSGTGNFLQSYGNLASGYVSPLHLSGVWAPKFSFRDYPDGVNSRWGYILMAFLIFELFFIFKSKNNKVVVACTAVLTFFLVASMFLLKNQYIEFKYISFLLPFISILFGMGLFNFFSEVITVNKWIPIFLALSFIAASLFLNLLSFRQVPHFGEDRINTYNYIFDTYMKNHSTLSLSVDNFYPYITRQKDDYSPLPQLPIWYNNQKIDYIIVDSIYGIESVLPKFFTDYPNVKAEIQDAPSRCITKLSTYTIYDENCR